MNSVQWFLVCLIGEGLAGVLGFTYIAVKYGNGIKKP